MFCLKCGEPISLLVLRDRKTGYIQYICSKCQTVFFRNSNGMIFPKDELRRFTDGENDELQ